MTQEDMFWDSEGGFVFGFGLPPEKGNLRPFKVVRIEAKQHDDQARLLTKIIRGLREEPLRILRHRPKQLGRIFDSFIERRRRIIIIISSAHLLTPDAIYSLKIIGRYSSSRTFRKSQPGFVLLGNPAELEALIKEEPGVWARSITLPSPQLRLVKW
jgi:hypothetical protein